MQLDVTTPLFKRDQVQRAIAMATGKIDGPDRGPSKTLKADLKRLLDLDRGKGVDWLRSRGGPVHFAFFDQEPPGSGVDIAYSFANAFRLHLGQRLLQGGLPQMEAVYILRQTRHRLDRALAGILAVPPEHRRPDLSAVELERQIRNGLLIRSAQAMTYFVTHGGMGAGSLLHRDPATGELESANVPTGVEELARVLEALALSSALPLMVVEIANPAYQLHHLLLTTPASRRGRPAKRTPVS
ncbi:MAG TPA: hypothetical protein VEY95_09560 [Azospirillaceae bacterium]|nr:hypothetical protein [Azospirillaceae bacterium]